MSYERPKCAHPMGELAVQNAKYAKNTTELHMGHRQLTTFEPDTTDGPGSTFDMFISLQVLWLHGNYIRDLYGMLNIDVHAPFNFRITELYLHNNRIETLLGSNIDLLPVLKRLSINGNSLRDLDDTIDVLRFCPNLTHLDFYGVSWRAAAMREHGVGGVAVSLNPRPRPRPRPTPESVHRERRGHVLGHGGHHHPRQPRPSRDHRRGPQGGRSLDGREVEERGGAGGEQEAGGHPTRLGLCHAGQRTSGRDGGRAHNGRHVDAVRRRHPSDQRGRRASVAGRYEGEHGDGYGVDGQGHDRRHRRCGVDDGHERHGR